MHAVTAPTAGRWYYRSEPAIRDEWKSGNTVELFCGPSGKRAEPRAGNLAAICRGHAISSSL
jgi:hypothetical protein